MLPFNHPLRVAEEITLLDLISDGRVDLGVGRRFQPTECFQIDQTQSHAMFDEALDIILQGSTDDIFAENGFVVVKDEEFPKLENPKLGTEFEINDYRGVIVGIAKVATGGLYGTPTLYTTYNRAILYIPSTRFTTSYILVEPKKTSDIPYIKQQIDRLGYLALTGKEFQDRISNYLKYQTGIGTNTLLMTVISFIVGLSISGQTFYTFILENLEHFGALKAMGAKGRELVYVILFQAGFTALVGYGLGVGLSTLLIAAAKYRRICVSRHFH